MYLTVKVKKKNRGTLVYLFVSSLLKNSTVTYIMYNCLHQQHLVMDEQLFTR